MGKIKLEKYVNSVVKALNEKTNENIVLTHIEMVKENEEYMSLKKRVVWDVCRYCYKPWKEMTKDDYDRANNNTFDALYKKAFMITFPNAFKKLTKMD